MNETEINRRFNNLEHEVYDGKVGLLVRISQAELDIENLQNEAKYSRAQEQRNKAAMVTNGLFLLANLLTALEIWYKSSGK